MLCRAGMKPLVGLASATPDAASAATPRVKDLWKARPEEPQRICLGCPPSGTLGERLVWKFVWSMS
jgi:hypothetical protein